MFIPFLRTPPHNNNIRCGVFVPQDDFRKEGEESSNMVVMQRTYHFLHSLADSLLAFILTRCGRSTKIILLRHDGGVFQSGAVQTMVRKWMKGNGELMHYRTVRALTGWCLSPVGFISEVNVGVTFSSTCQLKMEKC